MREVTPEQGVRLSINGKLCAAWPRGGHDDDSVGLTELEADAAGNPYDVAIIGAGVVGCALARELSLYRLKVLLVERNFDVGEATSKGNSAIVHTGFDAEPGTLEAELVAKASVEWPELARKLKIPYEPCGALLLALDESQARALESVRAKAVANGIDDVRALCAAEARVMEPAINPGTRRALLVPREAIADSLAASTAFAEVAIANGVDVLLGTGVESIECLDALVRQLVTDNGHCLAAKLIVNVAGLGGRCVAQLYGGTEFDINPRRGQFLVFDKSSRAAVDRILLPMPSKETKGVLVIPTIYGNLLAGPSVEDLPLDAEGTTDTSRHVLDAMLDGASKLYPGLRTQPIISQFAGVRCNCREGSYQIRANDGHKGIVTVAGIRSTGFTASPALGRYIVGILESRCGLALQPDPEAIEDRPELAWPGWWLRQSRKSGEASNRLARHEVICFCEQVLRSDIEYQLASPLRPRTLDAIKRRTRTQMGRCQGFDCQIRVAEIIADRCNIPLGEVTRSGPGSEIAAVAYRPTGGASK